MQSHLGRKLTFTVVAPRVGKILPPTEREEEIQSRRRIMNKGLGMV